MYLKILAGLSLVAVVVSHQVHAQDAARNPARPTIQSAQKLESQGRDGVARGVYMQLYMHGTDLEKPEALRGLARVAAKKGDFVVACAALRQIRTSFPSAFTQDDYRKYSCAALEDDPYGSNAGSGTLPAGASGLNGYWCGEFRAIAIGSSNGSLAVSFVDTYQDWATEYRNMRVSTGAGSAGEIVVTFEDWDGAAMMRLYDSSQVRRNSFNQLNIKKTSQNGMSVKWTKRFPQSGSSRLWEDNLALSACDKSRFDQFLATRSRKQADAFNQAAALAAEDRSQRQAAEQAFRAQMAQRQRDNDLLSTAINNYLTGRTTATALQKAPSQPPVNSSTVPPPRSGQGVSNVPGQTTWCYRKSISQGRTGHDFIEDNGDIHTCSMQ